MARRVWPAVVVALAVVLVRRRLGRFEIVEGSMGPALLPGDYVVTVRTRRVRRGDVVVFEHRPGFTLVKRVVGLPGEQVRLHDGRIAVDGRTLGEPGTVGVGADQLAGSWTLGIDEVFVLGDRKDRSALDSRQTGPIPLRTIEGRVAAIYWPPSRLRLFP